MAKQRPQPKAKARPTSVSATPNQASKSQGGGAGAPVVSAPKTDPPRRASYVEAVAVYERAMDSLQHHDYNQALTLLRSVLTSYPEEKELHERVRLYINVCERHATPQAAAPRTIEERLYASTLAINGGNYDEAIAQLRLVRDEDPDNDHALYMLAVAHAQRGEHAQAIAHLERSIALNPENRGLARQDTDFEPLMDDEAFRAAVEAHHASAADPDRRLSSRPRSGR